MKNGIKKFAKGMFAILLIKFVLIGFTTLNQACSIEPELNEKEAQKIALINFENLVNKTTPKLQLLIQNLEFKDLAPSSKSSNTLTNALIIQELEPLIEGTKIMFQNFGINHTDFEREFGNSSDPKIVLAGLAFLAAHNSSTREMSMNLSNLFVSKVYATESKDKTLDCAVEALGLNIFDAIRELGESGARMAAKSILKNVAKKFLGPIGIAITVAEFGWCMSRS